MRLCSLFVILFISVSCLGQAPRPSGFPTVNSPSAFYNLFGTLDSAKMFVQRDSFVAKYPSIIYHLNGNMYFNKGGIGSFWLPFTLASIRKVFAGYGLLNANDSTLQADSAVLANYFLRRSDSSYYVTQKNLKDSGSVYRGLVTTEAATARAAENLKLNYSDTAAMLLGYKNAINKNTDSITAHNIRIGANTSNIITNTANIALKVNYTDSNTIYQPKFRSDTARVNIYSALATKLDTVTGTFLKTVTLSNTGVIHNAPTYVYNNTTKNYTITQTLATQTANTVFAAPNGSSGTPTFRSIDSNYFNGNFQAQVRNAQSSYTLDTVTRFGGVKSIYKAYNDSLALSSKNVRVYFLVGESNSDGQVPIAEASASDTLTQPNVFITNITNKRIENLRVGVNNTGLNNTNRVFGWEVPILENTASTDTVYICKIAYSGATIATLISQLSAAYYYIDTTLFQIKVLGKTPIPYIIYSQGINNIGTDSTVWRNSTLSYINSIRNHIGYAPVFMTQFMTAYNGLNNTIVSIPNYDGWDYPISATGATTGTNGNNHWNKAGLVTIYNKMLDSIAKIGGLDNYRKTENDKGALNQFPTLKTVTLLPNFGSFDWGTSNVTQTNISLYTGADSSLQTGIGLNSVQAKLVLHTYGPSGGMRFVTGHNARTATDANSSAYTSANQFFFNTLNMASQTPIYWANGGAQSTQASIGVGNASNLIMAVPSGINPRIMWGAGQTIGTMTTSNASAFIDNNNLLNVNGLLATGNLSYATRNTTGEGLFLYNGGSSSTRSGVTINNTSARLVIHSYLSGTSGAIYAGLGQDASTMTSSNASWWISGVDNVLNVNKNLNVTNTLTTSNTILNLQSAPAVGSSMNIDFNQPATISRIAALNQSASNYGLQFFTYNSALTEKARLFANGNFQIGAVIDAGYKFYDSGSAKIETTLTVGGLNTQGIVTNNASGLLATSTGTGFVKSTAGVVSYDTRTYIDSIRQPSDALYGNAAFSVSGTTGISNATLNSQTANTVFAAPNGSTGTPTFRSLVLADMPAYATLTATNSTLTFSGSYNGLTAQTVGLNLGNANTWTGQQKFTTNNVLIGTTTDAGTGILQVTGNSYFSGTQIFTGTSFSAPRVTFINSTNQNVTLTKSGVNDFAFIVNSTARGLTVINESGGTTSGQGYADLTPASLAFNGGGGGNLTTIAGTIILTVNNSHPTGGETIIQTNSVNRFRVTNSFTAILNSFIVFGNQSSAAWGTAGIQSQFAAATFTDNSTAASTTVSGMTAINSIAIPTIASTNTAVTYSQAATLYIAGAPTAGANATITNSNALWINSGNSYFGGGLTLGGISAGSINDSILTKDASNIVHYRSINFLTNPLTTTGDIIYSSSGSTAARLPIASGVLSGTGGTLQYTLAPTLNKLTTGGLYTGYTLATGNYTQLTTDNTIEYQSGTFTTTLISAVSNVGIEIVIKNSGTGTITIATASSQTIDGVSTKTLSTQYSGIKLKSNGTNWMVIGTF